MKIYVGRKDFIGCPFFLYTCWGWERESSFSSSWISDTLCIVAYSLSYFDMNWTWRTFVVICFAVGHTYSSIIPFSLLMWLALQIFWRTFSAFHCTSHNSSFLMCLSVRPNLYVSLCCFIGSLCQLIFVSSLCILYVLTGWIVFADGKVQPYSP